jgi:hypothetical protein
MKDHPMRPILAVLCIAALAGCSTLNELGIGGEPKLMCSFRDGHAVIDDKLAGSSNVAASVVRRFADGDSLCMALKPASASSAPK